MSAPTSYLRRKNNEKNKNRYIRKRYLRKTLNHKIVSVALFLDSYPPACTDSLRLDKIRYGPSTEDVPRQPWSRTLILIQYWNAVAPRACWISDGSTKQPWWPFSHRTPHLLSRGLLPLQLVSHEQAFRQTRGEHHCVYFIAAATMSKVSCRSSTTTVAIQSMVKGRRGIKICDGLSMWLQAPLYA